MRNVFLTFVLGAALVTMAGCGKGGAGDLLPVTGTVTLDNNPVGNATVTFQPEGDTKGHGGSATTDAGGKYEVTIPQGKKGLVAGKYKVVISRRLNPDGTVPPANEPPIESKARETLPPRYSSPEQSELSAEVTPGATRAYDFALRSGK